MTITLKGKESTVNASPKTIMLQIHAHVDKI